jgi:hypothetical protein
LTHVVEDEETAIRGEDQVAVYGVEAREVFNDGAAENIVQAVGAAVNFAVVFFLDGQGVGFDVENADDPAMTPFIFWGVGVGGTFNGDHRIVFWQRAGRYFFISGDTSCREDSNISSEGREINSKGFIGRIPTRN